MISEKGEERPKKVTSFRLSNNFIALFIPSNWIYSATKNNYNWPWCYSDGAIYIYHYASALVIRY